MFPPPRPWTQRTSVEPEREYQAFTSRFFLKSMRRVPAFLASSFRIMKQANTAPGIIGAPNRLTICPSGPLRAVR